MENTLTINSESDVDHFFRELFKKNNLERGKQYFEKSSMTPLQKKLFTPDDSKTPKLPDFLVGGYGMSLIIENKQGLNNLEKGVKQCLEYAGLALRYSEEVVCVITAMETGKQETQIYYCNRKEQVLIGNNLNLIENKETLMNAINDYKGKTQKEKELLKINIEKSAKDLNKLMNDFSISASERVVFVAGMLLAMQDSYKKGATPDDLTGIIEFDDARDSKIIFNKINTFLAYKKIPEDKKKVMLHTFSEITVDINRDKPCTLHSLVAKDIEDLEASKIKQIFVYVYNNIFHILEQTHNIDLMGELYSEFLSYTLGDGKDLGIVLTPFYITDLMNTLICTNYDDKVLDVCTGTSGFLVSAMNTMISKANLKYVKGSEEANKIIADLKANNLMGIELNNKLYTLACCNMILRGDGSSNIINDDSFSRKDDINNFKATKALLNPPFSYTENGMPFVTIALDSMEKNGELAVIIQDSAGSGKATNSIKEILSRHTLKASIKMPTDLFEPYASVQTSIYVLQAHTPHDFKNVVTFIDFRKDGYKRTSRGTKHVDNPLGRYKEIIDIYKNGDNACCGDPEFYDIDKIYIEDKITTNYNDWNFEQHVKIDLKPTLLDFQKSIADYIKWEVGNIVSKDLL